MITLIDIDGVLADFNYGYRRKAKEMFGKSQHIKLFGVGKRPFTTWGDPDISAEQDDKIFYQVTQVKDEAFDFWLGLPSMVDKDTWRRLNHLSETSSLYFVTNRWGRWAHLYSRAWLHRQGIRQPSVILAKRKGLIAITVGAKYALDDKWENVWDMKTYCKAFLIDRPYNRPQEGPQESMPRVSRVADFLDIVEKDQESEDHTMKSMGWRLVHTGEGITAKLPSSDKGRVVNV